MIVKICGVRNLDDALLSCEAGADMLGFNFYPPSPRYIDPLDCATITAGVRRNFPSVRLVGVFVNVAANDIRAVLDRCGLDLAQLHGDEPPALQLALGGRAFKALRPANSEALRLSLGIHPLPERPPCFLIDAHQPGKFGGTGQAADWSMAAELAARYPILLAGGLNTENVSAAISQVHPWGVDTASGVENAPGHKDPQKIIAFIQAAKKAG